MVIKVLLVRLSFTFVSLQSSNAQTLKCNRIFIGVLHPFPGFPTDFSLVGIIAFSLGVVSSLDNIVAHPEYRLIFPN